MLRWEYHCEEMIYDPDEETDETLNELGAEGWELVSCNDTGNVETDSGFPIFAMIFKRPLESKEPTT